MRLCYLNFINYSYLIVNKKCKSAVIIDPAWEYQTVKQLIAETGAELKAVLLTHSHFDHVNLAGKLVDEFKAHVYISGLEAEYYNFRCKNLHFLIDMEYIRLGDINITCILTPGHTLGSICYYMDDCLFTGDTVFIEGCGICSLNGSNPVDMYKSIQRIKRMVNNKTRIFPGHSFGESPGKTIDYVSEKNIYFQIDEIKHFVEFRMRQNQRDLLKFY